MYWVFGDIHGMYDALKILIQRIEALHEHSVSKKNSNPLRGYDFKIDKLIFLGDYIDYGPSSKEVVDLMLSLKHETVFLTGNHEDMLMQFRNNSRYFKKFGNMWFRGTGGQSTVNSFRKRNFINISDSEQEFAPEDFKLKKGMPIFLKTLNTVTRKRSMA